MPWSTDGMYSRGMRPPVTLFSNSYELALGGVQRLEGHLHLGVLARATGLLLVGVVELLDGATDRLAVGHLRLADVGLDLELATHAVHEDVEVELAHAGDDGLAGLLVVVDLEGRVLLGELLDRRAELLLVALGLGLDGDLDDRVRGRSSTRARLVVGGSHSVSPVVVSLRPIIA